jgi:hypothetical protein
MATKAQSNDKDFTKAWPIPTHSHPNHLIKRGSQTACNHKLGYPDRCTLCKGSTLYPRVVISSLAKRLQKPPFCHSYTSFGVWPRDHYMSLQRLTTRVCHALLRFRDKWSPLAVLWFPAQSDPSCTMWFRQFTKSVTKTDHKDRIHPHSTEHDTQPIAYLISKQAFPYQTRGGTCCPRVSTPMIRSLADSSMTNHITWRNPTISTIPTLPKSQHRSSPRSNDISMDGRPPLTKTQAKLNITKDGKTCMTLMTTWLSITNQVWTQILKYEA